MLLIHFIDRHYHVFISRFEIFPCFELRFGLYCIIIILTPFLLVPISPLLLPLHVLQVVLILLEVDMDVFISAEPFIGFLTKLLFEVFERFKVGINRSRPIKKVTKVDKER